MRKKLIVILPLIILGVMIIGLLTACNNSSKYPKKPITWVVPFGTGGGSDQFARVMEKEIEKNTDIEIVVVNKPGAKTAVGFNDFMKKKSDGYTVFGATTDTIINMAENNVEYSLDDILPVAKVQHNIDMWFIHKKDNRFSNFDEMIEYMKTNNEKLSIGTTGLDGADAVSLKKVEEKFNVKFKNIPYSEPNERYAALSGKHVDILHEQPGDILSFLKNNEYIPIIVFNDKRVEGFEDIPTSIEKDLELTSGYWRGVWMKEGTNPEHVKTIKNAIKKAYSSNDYKEYEKNKYLHLREGLLLGEEFKNFLEDELNYYSE